MDTYWNEELEFFHLSAILDSSQSSKTTRKSPSFYSEKILEFNNKPQKCGIYCCLLWYFLSYIISSVSTCLCCRVKSFPKTCAQRIQLTLIHDWRARMRNFLDKNISPGSVNYFYFLQTNLCLKNCSLLARVYFPLIHIDSAHRERELRRPNRLEWLPLWIPITKRENIHHTVHHCLRRSRMSCSNRKLAGRTDICDYHAC